MTDDTKAKPDAFKAVLAAARNEAGRPELAHQNQGRALSVDEMALAEAMMEIYASGASGPEALAAALESKSVKLPSTGMLGWTAQNLEAEISALNAALDEAYQEYGFGA